MAIFIPRYPQYIIPVMPSPKQVSSKEDLEKTLKDYIDSIFKTISNTGTTNIDIKQLKRELKDEISSYLTTKCVLPDIHKKDLEQLDRNLRDYYNQNIKSLREELLSMKRIPGPASKDAVLDIQQILTEIHNEIHNIRENLNQLTGRVNNSGLYTFSGRLDNVENKLKSLETNNDLLNLKETLQTIRNDYNSKLDKTNLKLDDFINKHTTNLDRIPEILLRLDNIISKDELIRLSEQIDILRRDTINRLDKIEGDILPKTIAKLETYEQLAVKYQDILRIVDEKISTVVGPFRTSIDNINRRLDTIDTYKQSFSEEIKQIREILTHLNALDDEAKVNHELIGELDGYVKDIVKKINESLGRDVLRQTLNIKDLETRLDSLEQNRNSQDAFKLDMTQKYQTIITRLQQLTSNEDILKRLSLLEQKSKTFKFNELDAQIKDILMQILTIKEANDKAIQMEINKVKILFNTVMTDNINRTFDSMIINEKIIKQFNDLQQKIQLERKLDKSIKMFEPELNSLLMTKDNLTKEIDKLRPVRSNQPKIDEINRTIAELNTEISKIKSKIEQLTLRNDAEYNEFILKTQQTLDNKIRDLEINRQTKLNQL